MFNKIEKIFLVIPKVLVCYFDLLVYFACTCACFGFLILAKHPLKEMEKQVYLVEKYKTNPVQKIRGGYLNPAFKLQDNRGRIFIKNVSYFEMSRRTQGNKFYLAYREFDVSGRSPEFWAFFVFPLISGIIFWSFFGFELFKPEKDKNS